MIAAITSLFVIGASVIPMQSYADEHKKTGDFKSSVKASSDVDIKSASQHQDQDNFCYRGDECQQANQGQQIVGEDNEAKGFNDQSFNISISLSGTGGGSDGGTGDTGGGGTGDGGGEGDG